MDFWLIALCLMPVVAIIGAVIVMAREQSGHDRRGYGGR